MRKLEVVEYDPRWPDLFELERRLLFQTLGDVAVWIHHIGSTAVPGLAAKPTIDILIEVTDVVALDAFDANMKAIHYEPKREFGIPGRRYFKKGGDSSTHHIHAFARGDSNVTRYIAFRDYLRAYPNIAYDYAKLKKGVAARCNNSINSYCNGKDAYVKHIEADAIGWLMSVRCVETSMAENDRTAACR